MWGGQTPHNLVILCLCYANQTCSEVPISSSNRDTARLGRGDRILLPSVIPAQVQGRHNTTRSTLMIRYPLCIQRRQTCRRITPGIPPFLAVAPIDRTQQGIWDWPVQSPRHPQELILSQKLRRKQKKRAITEEAKPKTAFVPGGPHGSKYQFNRCPFGLSQAPAYFQRLVHEVLRGLPFTFGYLDDILIFSSGVEGHLEHLRKVFLRLREAKLELKASKCSFFKKNIQYLGHLVSGDGIEPEKLEAVENMPPPKTPKEIRQFLGLVGYYRKFVPKFADIARPLTNLTKQDIKFEWTDKCQKTFQLLKDMLLKEPILKYPDPSKPYTLFTDASKYAWACVLTQEYEHEFDGKIKKILHPITYVSGLFKGSQVNWATLTKEAYAIYMSVKKLPYYLQDADIILRSDHLPLKKFLSKNTLNTKVNNWAIEISPYRIQFEYIKGIKILWLTP